MPAFADNCANFTDCWTTVLAFILASVAIPALFALNMSERFLESAGDALLGPRPNKEPPEPPLTWDDRSPRERLERTKRKPIHDEEQDGFDRPETHREED